MGRHSKNIKMQLNDKLDSLLRIGQRKVKCDADNPNRSEGIHSIRTAQTYRSVANGFGEYLKGQGVRCLNDIEHDHVGGYICRASLSAYTYSKELSAINKLLDSRYTPRDFGLQQRSHQMIINNRGLARHDTSNAERNRAQLDFVTATGIRRESIATITPAQAVRDSTGQVIGFSVVEKGGRARNCVVLSAERKRITALVDKHIQRRGQNIPFFSSVDRNANPHWCRRLYAQALYSDLCQAAKVGQDYYSGLRNNFINQQAFDYAVGRYSRTTVCSYERDVLAEVSQNLGHNRVDVVIYHYMK